MTEGVVLLAVISAEVVRATLARPGSRPSHNTLGACRDQHELASFLRDFLARAGSPLLIGAAIAASGPESDGVIVTGASRWPLDRRTLRKALDTPNVRLVHGVVACALAAPGLGADRLTPLHAASICREAAMASILPEESVGVAFVLPDAAGGWLPIQSYAGFISLRPANEREAAVMARLGDGAVPAETLLSRSGLAGLHRALKALDGAADRPIDAIEVMALGRAGDPWALEALRLYSAWLGGFCGDVALIGRARGGIYLNSLFLRELGDLIDKAAFDERYTAKAKGAARYVAGIPVFQLTTPTGLDGLATLFSPSDARFGQADVHVLDC